MSHFGRSGPPDISDTYSLLVLNISFRQYLPPPLSLSLSLLRFFAFLEFPLRRVCVLRVLISSCDLGMVQVQLLMICSRSSTSTGRLLMYSSPGTEGLFSLAFLTTSLFSVLFFLYFLRAWVRAPCSRECYRSHSHCGLLRFYE